MQKGQDASLDESDNRYRTLLASVGEAIISADIQGRVDFMNPAAERLTGWTESEARTIQSDEVLQLLNGDTRAPVENPVQRVLRDGKRFEFTDCPVLIARNGGNHSITGTGSPVRNARGELTNAVLVFRERAAEPAISAKLPADGAYRSLFENMLNGLAYCKMLFENGKPADYVYLDVNTAFETLTGLKNVVGRRVSEVIPNIQQLDPELFEILGRVALTGKPERFETYLEALKMWFLISVYSPEKEHFIAIFDVTTERKRAEVELRESETRYRALAESLPHLVWTCRGDGPCDYLSPRWVEYTGILEADQLGYGWLDQLHPDDRERVVAEWTKVAPIGDTFDIEFRIRRADGQYRWFKTRAIPFRDNSGRVAKWFGSNTDIDDQKRAHEALRQSEERLRATLRSIGDGVVSTDAAGRVTQINPVAEALTGWTEAEATGKPAAEVFRIINEDARAEVESPIARVLREGQIVGLANHTLLIGKDGTECPIADSGAPILDSCGNVTGVVLVFRDQSEERRTRHELEKSEAKFRDLFDNSQVGIYRSRLDGTGFLDVNQRLADLVGYTKEEMLGNPSTVHWANSKARETMLRVVRERSEIKDFEVELFNKSRDVRTVLLSIKAYPDQGYLEGTAVDITERKRAEAKLAESEQRYAVIFDKAPFAMALSKLPEVTTVGANDAFLRLFEYTREEILGKTSVDLGIADAETRAQVSTELREHSVVRNFECSRVTKSGDVRIVSLNVEKVTIGSQEHVLTTVQDITERKHAEKEIEYLAKFPLENPHPILRVRYDGNVMYANPSSKALLDAWGCNVGAFLPSNLRDLIVKSLATREPTPVEVSCNSRIISVLFVPISGTDYINLYGRDITERARAQDALRKSEARLSFALQTINTGAWELDLRDYTANRTLTHDQIFGYESLLPSWTFEVFLEHVLPEDRGDVDRRFRDATAGQTDWKFECRIRRIDGQVRWIRAVGRHELGSEGKPVRMAGVVQDITEQKRAQEILNSQYALINAIINSSEDITIFSFDRNYRYTAFNDKHRRQMKVVWNVDISIDTNLLDCVHIPELRDLAKKSADRALGGESFVEEQFQLDRDKYYEFHWNPVVQGANVVGVAVFAQDITARTRTQAKLQKAVEDLARSNKELEQFAYVASHDLQEPLRMVASYTQLLAQRYENQLDDKAKMYIDYAVDGAVRMQQLIQDLLKYSRLNTQAKPLELTNVNQVLLDVFRNLEVAIDESKASVATDELPTVRADASQLVHVFQNLIANGIKFRREVPPRIRVSAIDDGPHWRFSVQDNGIGIEPQYSDRVFVIFQRLHTRQEYPGTGIGLTVCKRIIVRHGGKIWFESEAGKGTTFFFTIPK